MALSRSLWLCLAVVASSGAAKTCSVDGEECFDEEKYIEQQQVQLLQAQMKVHKADKHAKSEDEIVGSDVVKDLPVLPEDRTPRQRSFIETEGGVKPANHVRYEKKLLHAMMQKQSPDGTLQAIDDVLNTAEELTGDSEVESALEEFEQTVANGENASSLVVGNGSDHEAVMKAIEEMSVDMSPEDAVARNGQPITGKLINRLNGIVDTPEQAPANFSEPHILVEADMLVSTNEEALMLSQLAKAGKAWTKKLWKNNMAIPYCFSYSLATKSKKAFQDAVQHYKQHIPCVGFKEVSVKNSWEEKCSEEPGIFVKSNKPGMCFANLGQPSSYNGKYNPSVCHLGSGCDTMGVAAHEIGHNLGMLHEQSRPDHSQYVTILWYNIKTSPQDMRSQYKLDDINADTTVDYDIMSLMHYGDSEFGAIGSDGRPKTTMLFNGASSKTMGNRQGLTMADSKQLAKMYKCEGQLTTFTLCTSKEDSATYVPCKCHAPYFKTKKGSGYKCAANKCPDFAGGNGRTHCGCPVTCKTECFNNGGKRYCGCKDCNTATSTTPAARPPPPPTPPSTSTTAPPPPTWTPPSPTPPASPPSPTPPASHTFKCKLDWEAHLKKYCANVNTYPFIAATADCTMSYTHSSYSAVVSSCTNHWGYQCYLYDSYGSYSCYR